MVAPGRPVESAEHEVRALAERFSAECVVTDRAPAGQVVTDHPLVRRLVGDWPGKEWTRDADDVPDAVDASAAADTG